MILNVTLATVAITFTTSTIAATVRVVTTISSNTWAKPVNALGPWSRTPPSPPSPSHVLPPSIAAVVVIATNITRYMRDKPVTTLLLGHALISYPASVVVTFTTATTATIILIAAAAKTATNTS